MKHQDERALIEGCHNLGCSLSQESLSKFRTYLELLLSWNRRINLFSRRDEPHLVFRHILPSLAPLAVLPEGPFRAVDIGSGAGFPGIPIKILRRDIRITLVESRRMKALFLRKVVEELGLEGAEVIWTRAEELARDPAHRRSYDWALARAVAELPTIIEYATPLLREGGGILTYKSSERSAAELTGVHIRWEAYEIRPHPSMEPVSLVILRV